MAANPAPSIKRTMRLLVSENGNPVGVEIGSDLRGLRAGKPVALEFDPVTSRSAGSTAGSGIQLPPSKATNKSAH